VNSRVVAMTALRFLYGVTLRRERFIEMLPMLRKEHYLRVILSPAEVLRFLEAAPPYPDRVIFSIMHGTGMRVSEALHLRVRHIDSRRMMIRIEQSKRGTRTRDSVADDFIPVPTNLAERKKKTGRLVLLNGKGRSLRRGKHWREVSRLQFPRRWKLRTAASTRVA
jgi:integrase